LFGKASGPKALPPDLLNALPYLTGFGDKSFLEQIKERLGIRGKGRKIYESDDEYQLREGQTVYGDWLDSEYENTFAWKLVN
jgi:hypothetical protein